MKLEELYYRLRQIVPKDDDDWCLLEGDNTKHGVTVVYCMAMTKLKKEEKEEECIDNCTKH